MKMKYLPSKERGNKKRSLYLTATIFLVVCLYFWHASVASALYRVGVNIAAPFWVAENYIADKTASFLINFEDKENLINKNEYLNKQIQSIKYYSLENKLIQGENEELKKLLGRGELGLSSEAVPGIKVIDKNKILAYVLSGPAAPPYDSLILDAGLGLGIRVGDTVVSPEDIAMGEIVEVAPNYSKARLYSSYGLKTNVLLGANQTMIEMIGMGGGNFYIAMPQDYIVKNNDLAISPGPDLRQVAFVGRIEGKDGEMFKNIFLSAPFNVKETRLVGIIKKELRITPARMNEFIRSGGN